VVSVALPEELVRLDLGDVRWTSYVAGSAAATPFHAPAWGQLLAATYGFRGFALALAGDGGALRGGAPFLAVRRPSGRSCWISLPFTDECPLLADDVQARGALVRVLAETQVQQRVPGIELRDMVEGYGWSSAADAVIHELELDRDIERVRARFSKSQVRRNISRAERDGVVVRRATSSDDLDAFYALHTQTRRRQGVPVQPRRFFEQLWARLVEPGAASILLADAGGRTAVAGALFLIGNGTTIYKFGASDVESWPLRPNHLIFWTAIREACERGDRRFDFGRTDLDNAGLRAFKSGWGAEERPLRYSSRPRAADASHAGLLSRGLSVAIRRGPRWVCRGAGAALYRYAASR
jgi:CelD/BcsL family acetyltransferase involved in cellulose biosynthesis